MRVTELSSGRRRRQCTHLPGASVGRPPPGQETEPCRRPLDTGEKQGESETVSRRKDNVQKARLPGAASSESLRRKKGELCTVEEGPESASNVPPRCQGHRQEASIRQVLAASRRNRREALCLTSAPEGRPQDCAFTSKPAPPAWEYPGGSCVSDPEVDDKMNKLAEYYFDSS